MDEGDHNLLDLIFLSKKILNKPNHNILFLPAVSNKPNV